MTDAQRDFPGGSLARLRFEAGDIRSCAHTALPRLALELKLSALPAGLHVRGVSLNVQVQIEPAARRYSAVERERLSELFGAETQWPGSLQSVLWTRLTTQLGAFQHTCRVELDLPCGADLELVANKYCFGIQAGDVPLRLLFSGSILHGEGRLQVTPIGLDSELTLRLPLHVVQQSIAQHHAQQMLLGLRRDVFERLYHYRRQRSLPSWERVVEALLDSAGASEERA